MTASENDFGKKKVNIEATIFTATETYQAQISELDLVSLSLCTSSAILPGENVSVRVEHPDNVTFQGVVQWALNEAKKKRKQSGYQLGVRIDMLISSDFSMIRPSRRYAVIKALTANRHQEAPHAADPMKTEEIQKVEILEESYWS